MSGVEYRYGRNPVKELLTHAPERVQKLFIQRTREGARPDKRLSELIHLARVEKIVVQEAPPDKLAQLSGDPEARHQGVVALVSAQPALELDKLIDEAKARAEKNGLPPILLMLDGITDPHNLGALFRVAEAAGAAGMIWGRHGGVSLTPSAAKAAVGADALVPHAVVTNLTKALEELKQAGYWTYGAAAGPGTTRYDQLKPGPEPLCIVMGAEGKGLSPLVRKTCDGLLSIPMHGQLDSLNVSTAAAVLLFELRRHTSSS